MGVYRVVASAADLLECAVTECICAGTGWFLVHF